MTIVITLTEEMLGMCSPTPRQVVTHIPDGGAVTYVDRPLRASTPQGERIALAVSEAVPVGSWIEFSIALFDKSMTNGIVECLDYGVFRGLGQWRNSGKGRFVYELK